LVSRSVIRVVVEQPGDERVPGGAAPVGNRGTDRAEREDLDVRPHDQTEPLASVRLRRDRDQLPSVASDPRADEVPKRPELIGGRVRGPAEAGETDRGGVAYRELCHVTPSGRERLRCSIPPLLSARPIQGGPVPRHGHVRHISPDRTGDGVARTLEARVGGGVHVQQVTRAGALVAVGRLLRAALGAGEAVAFQTVECGWPVAPATSRGPNPCDGVSRRCAPGGTGRAGTGCDGVGSSDRVSTCPNGALRLRHRVGDATSGGRAPATRRKRQLPPSASCLSQSLRSTRTGQRVRAWL